MAWSFMLEKAEVLLDNPLAIEELDLNLLMEFQHIKQYFENDLYLPKWSEETKSAYQTVIDWEFQQMCTVSTHQAVHFLPCKQTL